MNVVTFTEEPLIRSALFNHSLSRSFDKRGFAAGNPRADVVSVLHGSDHLQRRRIENVMFRAETLAKYEQEFPRILDAMVPMLTRSERADLLEIGETLSVALASQRAGIDVDYTDIAALRDLVDFVLTWSQATAFVDLVGDREAALARARSELDRFDARFFTPSYERRLGLEPAMGSGTDMLTVLLDASRNGTGGLSLSRELLLRETATYVQAGTHTSGQTLVHVFDLVKGWAATHGDAWSRLSEDLLFAQRCVHETLRLRPTTPSIKRLAEEDTVVGDVPIPKGSIVALDVRAANRSPNVWGPDADDFNPERHIPAGEQPWGLSFGAGPHICIGRGVAAGVPAHGDGEAHVLTGLIAQMVQALCRRGVRPAMDDPPVLDTRTNRGSRWLHYPVRIGVEAYAE